MPPGPPAAEVVAHPVVVQAVAVPAPRGPRDFLLSSTAAVLLLVGLLSLPNMLPRGAEDGTASAATVPAASLAPGPDAAPVAAERQLDILPVTNVLRLPGGYTFEVVETATGLQTVVSELPADIQGDLEVGDVLLVYAVTGETLATPTALREILQRDFASGITTYSFVIRRGDSTLNAEFRLGVAG
jgi:hypothetical protein